MDDGIEQSCRGAVYVEFLIVFGPFMTLFLGLVQLGLIYSAHILVEHAAAKAARAAIVILPDDHEKADYGGDPVNQLNNGNNKEQETDKGRYQQIRRAARLVLSPLSPAADGFRSNTVAKGIGPDALWEMGMGLALYSDWALEMRFVNSEGAEVHRFSPGDTVNVEIRFLYRCGIPLARDLLCSSLSKMSWEQGGALAGLAIVDGWRFAPLEARRSLPLQGAY